VPRVDVVRESKVSGSPRCRQLEGMFDVPRQELSRVAWSLDVPIDEKPWKVGLIVGPSGSGKSTIARELFGSSVDRPLTWVGASVVDDFPASLSMKDVAGVCQAVGFNTIPNWLRPFDVLSNGERFRVELARRLVESDGLVVMDEFTSVVDRQVAKIGAHAVQKYVRRREDLRFVGVTCHYDVEEWLQPDWTLDMATVTFAWRSVQRRPPIECTISPVPYSVWQMFAPFHYLTRTLHRAARCFALFVGDRPAAFAGMLHRTAKRPIMGCSRLVTLPDYQGLGLAFVLIDAVASVYGAKGISVNTYPAHPALITCFDRSERWRLVKRPGIAARSQFAGRDRGRSDRAAPFRPNATFEYAGPSASVDEADRVLAYWSGRN